MANKTWFLMKMNLAGNKPLFNAVRLFRGETIECDQPATTSEAEARKRVDRLNYHAELFTLLLQKEFAGGAE